MLTKAGSETNPPHMKLKKKTNKKMGTLELIYDCKSNSTYDMKN